MKFLTQLAIGALYSIVSRVAAVPIQVQPGTAEDVVLTLNNTVNSTTPFVTGPAPQIGQLQLSLKNNLNGGQVNAYVTGLDSKSQLVMLQPDGQWYYPIAGLGSVPQPIDANVAIPLGGEGSTTDIALPSYISAARVWFAEGELQFFTVRDGNGNPALVEPSAVNPTDPSANVNWGFVELTNTDGGLYANISYVDFVGLVLGMTLTTSSGDVQTSLGLSADAVSSICADLAAQSARDGQAWGDLCVHDTNGQQLRVLNPTDYLSIQTDAFADYWTSYIDQVWSQYTNQPLTINTQAAAGSVQCLVDADSQLLNCDGDNRGYAKPTAGDIFGCNSGPFAIEGSDNPEHCTIVPRLCAAFNRGTLLLGDGNVQPGPDSSEYYQGDGPFNWYSAIVHKYEVDGKGYAFSYDDVNPSSGDDNASGVVSAGDPNVLEITIGGPN